MTRPHAALVGMLIACLLCLLFGGCAMLPMPFQPATQDNSNAAEGTFLVLATVDTLQTIQIAKHPKCFYERDPLARALYGSSHPSVGKVIGINLLMITAHTMLASWLDDKAAAENTRYNDEDHYGLGPWELTRFAFHAVSLGAEASATIGNWQRGLHVNNAVTCPAEQP